MNTISKEDFKVIIENRKVNGAASGKAVLFIGKFMEMQDRIQKSKHSFFKFYSVEEQVIKAIEKIYPMVGTDFTYGALGAHVTFQKKSKNLDRWKVKFTYHPNYNLEPNSNYIRPRNHAILESKWKKVIVQDLSELIFLFDSISKILGKILFHPQIELQIISSYGLSPFRVELDLMPYSQISYPSSIYNFTNLKN